MTLRVNRFLSCTTAAAACRNQGRTTLMLLWNATIKLRPLWGNGRVVGGPTWYHTIAVGQPYLLVLTVFLVKHTI